MPFSKLSRFCDGVMEAAWLAALMIAPVFFNVFSSRIFEPDKIAIVRSLAVLILAAWFIKIIDQKGVSWQNPHPESSLLKTIWHTPLLAPVVITCVIYIISTIFSVTPRASLFGSYQRLQGTYTFFSYIIIFLAMVVNLRSKQQVERLVTAVIIASLPVALFGILQRYKLDPIPWGADTSIRVASNLGNSIFVAAYLIMVIPLTIYRIVEDFRAIIQGRTQQFLHVTRASLNIFILILQLITVYFSGSRGPLLGLLAGLYFMFLLLSLIWGLRWLSRLILVGAIIGVVLLSFLNIPNGPLETLRNSPAVGRFGRLLDTESNTAKVRYYIWVGASQLVAPHEPIEFPDGSKDRLNLLRPLIGYGPESMYVAFNPFYVPELAHVERRNASPDRSHNETWDSLVTTGAFGFGSYLALFLIFFYYGLSWLGIIAGKRQKILYWGLAFAGGVIGSVAVIAWGGIPYLGVGLPFGIMVGLLVYLAIASVTGHYSLPTTPAEATRAVLLIALVSAAMAHWLEINFGIAILSTRLYFWVDVALLIIVGYILPMLPVISARNEAEKPAPQPAATTKAGTRSKRQKSSPHVQAGLSGRFGIYPELFGGLTLALVLSALSYSFLTNSNRATNLAEIIIGAMTRLPTYADAQSFGILGLFIITWLVGSILWASESTSIPDRSRWLKSVLVTTGISFVGWLIYLLWHAASLSSLAQSTIRTQSDLLLQVGKLGGLLTNMYVYGLLLILVIAYFINTQAGRERPASQLAMILAPFMLIFVILISNFTNLKVVHADVTFKMAEPFTNDSQWPFAAFMYNHAIDQSPNEDYYYLFLGRAYLEQAKLVESDQDKSALANQADRDLKKAQRLNPLNTDHTANLARLYSWWAGSTSDAAARAQLADTSSNYYERAVSLSRNSAVLWAEWGLLYLELFDRPEEALARLQKAINLDSRYPLGLALIGEYYSRIAQDQTDPLKRLDVLKEAEDYFLQAVAASVGRDSTGKVGYLVALGNVYLSMAENDPTNVDTQKLQQAADTFVQALQANPASSGVYRIEEQIGRIYYQLKDIEKARLYLENSIAHAPESERVRLNQLLQQILISP